MITTLPCTRCGRELLDTDPAIWPECPDCPNCPDCGSQMVVGPTGDYCRSCLFEHAHDGTRELLVTAADRLEDLAEAHTVGTIQLASDLRRTAEGAL